MFHSSRLAVCLERSRCDRAIEVQRLGQNANSALLQGAQGPTGTKAGIGPGKQPNLFTLRAPPD